MNFYKFGRTTSEHVFQIDPGYEEFAGCRMSVATAKIPGNEIGRLVVVRGGTNKGTAVGVGNTVEEALDNLYQVSEEDECKGAAVRLYNELERVPVERRWLSRFLDWKVYRTC